MGIRTMKLDLFTIKALQSKGYEVEQLLALTDEEVEALPISTKLIEGVKTLRLRGGQSADAIAEQIADLMMREESDVPEELVQEYKEVPEVQEEVISEAVPVSELVGVMARKVTPEELAQIEQAKDEDAAAVETEFATEDVIRVESKAEDIEIIKEALQGKDAKSFQPYIKHLKTAVPEAILDAVDSTLVSDMIEARIAEVKAQQEKTK